MKNDIDYSSVQLRIFEKYSEKYRCLNCFSKHSQKSCPNCKSENYYLIPKHKRSSK